MPKLDDPTIKLDRPRPDFRTANPDVFGRAQGDVETTRRLGAIEERAAAIQQRFREHFERHELVWVAAEALRLSKSRTFPTLDYPRPRGFEPPNLVQLMMGTAKHNVHARAIGRMSAIHRIKTAMQNATVNNTPRQVQLREPSNDQRPQQNHRLRQSGP